MGMTNARILNEVANDNMRSAQIGTTDGMSPDVAADLGYNTPEEVARLIGEARNHEEAQAFGATAMAGS